MAQNSNPGPTWYDILGVTPESTPDQVKAAWRDATDKFEPGTGASQFRLFNEAADVLLDPEKRAAYDAELALTAPDEVTTEPTPVVAAEPPPVVKLAETSALPPAPEPAPTDDAPPAPFTIESAGGGIPLGARIVAVLAFLAVASL